MSVSTSSTISGRQVVDCAWTDVLREPTHAGRNQTLPRISHWNWASTKSPSKAVPTFAPPDCNVNGYHCREA